MGMGVNTIYGNIILQDSALFDSTAQKAAGNNVHYTIAYGFK